MTDQEQNIAVAKACGWKKVYQGPEPDDRWITPDGLRYATTSAIPDYGTDLNAMHEAEKVLDEMNGGIGSPDCLRYAYSRELYKIVAADEQPMRATAVKRREAFLRAIGKWK